MAEQRVLNPENHLHFALSLETTNTSQIFQPDKVALEQNRKMNIQLNLDLDAGLDQVNSAVPAYIHFISSSASLGS